MLSRPFQEHMCPVYVRIGEFIRIAEAEVDMRLRREMEDGVDLVLAQYALHVRWGCDISILEREVGFILENARVVQGRAVVELVVRHDIVVIRVC